MSGPPANWRAAFDAWVHEHCACEGDIDSSFICYMHDVDQERLVKGDTSCRADNLADALIRAERETTAPPAPSMVMAYICKGCEFRTNDSDEASDHRIATRHDTLDGLVEDGNKG